MNFYKKFFNKFLFHIYYIIIKYFKFQAPRKLPRITPTGEHGDPSNQYEGTPDIDAKGTCIWDTFLIDNHPGIFPLPVFKVFSGG